MTSHILLIDANNLGYASMYTPALSRLSHAGEATGGIVGLAQSVLRITRQFPGAVPVVLWDGHAAWRKTLCPAYKANRNATPEKRAITDSWHRQQPIAQALLQHMGVIQLRSPDAEADDLAGRLSLDPEAMTRHAVARITLVSGDTDWWQALSERVDWMTPITDKTMTLEKLRTDAGKSGFFTGPEEYILSKAIAGDSSDNIAGVAGVGLVTAAKLLRAHGGLEGIRQAVTAGVAQDRKSQAIAEAYALIDRNRHLMDWRMAPASFEPVQILHQSFDPQACHAFCLRLGMSRFSERLLTEWNPADSTAEVLRYCRDQTKPILETRSVA